MRGILFTMQKIDLKRPKREQNKLALKNLQKAPQLEILLLISEIFGSTLFIVCYASPEDKM